MSIQTRIVIMIRESMANISNDQNKEVIFFRKHKTSLYDILIDNRRDVCWCGRKDEFCG